VEIFAADGNYAIAIAIAILGGFGAAFGAIMAAYLQRRTAERNAAEQVARERDDVVRRYRDPLLWAAFELQSRLYNILRNDFLGKYFVRGTEMEQNYSRDSTLYVVAQYFGWLEVVRRDVQFLDLGRIEMNQLLNDRFEAIAAAFWDDSIDPVLRAFRGEQRAIGEIMLQPVTSGPHRMECIGYATFFSRLEDPAFARWFAKLREDVELLAPAPSRHSQRLIVLQNRLMDLIDFLDEGGHRLPLINRQRLSMPSAGLETPVQIDEGVPG
jgi:hypothetical protein